MIGKLCCNFESYDFQSFSFHFIRIHWLQWSNASWCSRTTCHIGASIVQWHCSLCCKVKVRESGGTGQFLPQHQSSNFHRGNFYFSVFRAWVNPCGINLCKSGIIESCVMLLNFTGPLLKLLAKKSVGSDFLSFERLVLYYLTILPQVFSKQQ